MNEENKIFNKIKEENEQIRKLRKIMGVFRIELTELEERRNKLLESLNGLDDVVLDDSVVSEEVYENVCIGYVCKVLYNKQGDVLWGVVIEKSPMISEEEVVTKDDRFRVADYLMGYWYDNKNITIVDPKYVFKIVLFPDGGKGYWYPDSCILEFYRDPKSEFITDFYNKNGYPPTDV